MVLVTQNKVSVSISRWENIPKIKCRLAIQRWEYLQKVPVSNTRWETWCWLPKIKCPKWENNTLGGNIYNKVLVSNIR